MKNKEKPPESYHLVIVGFGLLIRQKYVPIINDFHKRGIIDSVSIVELEDKKDMIERRLSEFEFPEVSVFYTLCDSLKPFMDYVRYLKKRKGNIKVVIATEVKAHEQYLDYCVRHDIECLVEKPVLSAMNEQGQFDPNNLDKHMERIVHSARKSKKSHSVMCFSRNHTFYNDVLIKQIDTWMEKYKAPLTTINLHTNSGIWNLNHEYVSREDHPYKYGYGMLMHGAYHYIDIFAQILKRNLALNPHDEYALNFSAYAVYPEDQEVRIPEHIGSQLGEKKEYYESEEFKKHKYGETDLSATFSLVNVTKNKTVTIGALSFEQTSPGMRNWSELPDDVYNKNGRTSHTDILVQMSTLCSVQAQTYKVKDVSTGIDKYIATKLTRTNSAFLPDEVNCELTEYGEFSNSNANMAMLVDWLNGVERKSNLQTHELTMSITAALAKAIHRQGKKVTIKLRKSAWEL